MYRRDGPCWSQIKVPWIVSRMETRHDRIAPNTHGQLEGAVYVPRSEEAAPIRPHCEGTEQKADERHGASPLT